jgi:hypothetical protein
VSRKAERLTQKYVAAVMERTGITKAAGPMTAGVLYAAVRPMAEVVVSQDKAIRKSDRKSRQFSRELKQINRILEAIVQPPASVGSVPYRPEQWDTRLVPKRAPVPVNGHSYSRMEQTHEQETPPGHPG